VADSKYSQLQPLISFYRLVLFFSDLYCFPDPSVHFVAFSVDYLGSVPVRIKEAIDILKEQDKSMNRDEDSYQLSYVCDYLLSATVTPGGQSFRRRQQRLPKCQQQFSKRLCY